MISRRSLTPLKPLQWLAKLRKQQTVMQRSLRNADIFTTQKQWLSLFQCVNHSTSMFHSKNDIIRRNVFLEITRRDILLKIQDTTNAKVIKIMVKTFLIRLSYEKLDVFFLSWKIWNFKVCAKYMKVSCLFFNRISYTVEI